MKVNFKKLINKYNCYFFVLSLINIIILVYLLLEESKVVNITFQVFVSSIGGILAAVLTFTLSSRKKIKDRRLVGYIKHRNTLVQIEHELIPTRINIGNNIKALEDAIEQFESGVYRLILRMYKLDLSKGLSLKLLSLDFINDYAETYILLKKINSDIDYLNQIVIKIQDWQEKGKDFRSLLVAYKKLIDYMLIQCKKVDKKTLELASKCKLALSDKEQEKEIKDNYCRNGDEIKYVLDESQIKSKENEVIQEEKRPFLEGETPDQTFMLYMDLILTKVRTNP